CLLVFGPTAAQGATPGAGKWGEFADNSSFPTGGKASGSPAISADGQSIYITSEDGKLYRISAGYGPYGQGNWSVPLGNGPSYDEELISSPVVAADGSIYVAATAANGSQSGHLYNVNANGTVRWSFPLALSIGDPIVGAVALG